ncbi:BrnT family toxin [Duganella sp. BJB488]|uniref:BrnT family toxin n=1 Tax=unclassified Duganella TaxID=2636909 RepID=UPI000E34FA96|nr:MULTISPECIES: BrnT family toxin [unclassified Duganella]RFP16917.1 BrnT family toxin [Duganella sp. BJB489]RFP20663.1 BrnT family toxin [Duganella sp. BJB488]RFP32283.1 BrnT family toxin [Duganella sp. BJB480]
MVITFDPKKDKLNQRKHGISLSAASAFDWDNAVIWTDQRYHYSELRECALGSIADRLYFVVFVDEHFAMRVISLREASRSEVKRYAFEKT